MNNVIRYFFGNVMSNVIRYFLKAMFNSMVIGYYITYKVVITKNIWRGGGISLTLIGNQK